MLRLLTKPELGPRELLQWDQMEKSGLKSGLEYVAGDLEHKAYDALVVRELSRNWHDDAKLISVGEVPLDVHGLGVLFPEMFGDCFEQFEQDHKLGELTLGENKTNAGRKGMLLSEVGEDGSFQLMRCSTNFELPTHNLSAADRKAMRRVNEAARRVFGEVPAVNSILAQKYVNTAQLKSRISSHSDKTKDIAPDSFIAFVTHYDMKTNAPQKGKKKLRRVGYDWLCGETSVLTKLRFRRKQGAPSLEPETFDVTLYPGSVFMIPLRTNELYTHETVPSNLPHDWLPTRLGCVMRCSRSRAVFRDGAAYIVDGEELRPLTKPTPEQLKWLKDMYRRENLTTERVVYPLVDFTMNDGDLLAPVR